MNAYTLCRLCLKDGTDLNFAHNEIAGRSEDSPEQSLEQLVMQYLPIQIIKSEHSGYPFICGCCISQIKQWHRFCTSCIDNDTIYQKKLLSEQQIHNDQSLNRQEKIVLKEEIMLESSHDDLTTEQYLGNEPTGTIKVEDNSDNDHNREDTSNAEVQKAEAENKETIPENIKEEKLVPEQYNFPKTHSAEDLDKFLVEPMDDRKIGRKYQCPHCPSSFAARNKFREHINVHTRLKMYKCDQCDKEYTRRDSLKLHKVTHSKERKYVCPVCEKTFYQRTALARHKRKHFEQPTVKCTECDYMTYSNCELRLHFKKHLKERPFVCELCGHTFYRKNNLKTHLERHQKNATDKASL
ncbi:zinc finger protein 25 [Aedes albopictus]|uniref:C2h2-type zn-finger protein n=1 Tax=Aedes albopictus TaxID=7160 RepID=A0ABM2A5W4_AEDAL